MSIYDKASLVQIPSGYKSGTLYSVVPNTTAGDFTVTGDPQGEATRVNKDGLIEMVSADVPRLNYNFIDGVVQPDPHLLLEPTRTNLITQSTELTSGDLAKVNITVSDNTGITDPQGGTDAKTLTASSTSQPRLEWRGTSVPASNTSYAMSFWVRYNTARYVAIAHFSQTGEYAIFDLVDGAVESDVGTQTAKIEAYKNGWYRISKSFEVPSSASLNYWKFTLCTQTNAFVGVSGEKADVFGLQLEAGSYPTSYIPTSGSAVTRTNDLISNSYTGLTSASGTIFLDLDTKGLDSNYSKIIALRDTVTGDTLRLEPFDNSGTKKFAFFGINGSSATPPSEDILPINNRKKIALTFDSGNFKYASDGVITTGTYSGTARQYNQIGGANITGGAVQNGIIHQLMVFDEVLSDSELETITSYKSFGQMAKALLYTIE